MSYYSKPNCQKPQNLNGTQLSQTYGSELLLRERYRASKVIGQGTFGTTFLAVDEDNLSTPRCIIKQFLPQVQGTNTLEKAAELFEQEAVRLDELGKHDQIPELLAHFEQNGQLYLVQEFIDGQNLAKELEEQGAFNETQIRQLLNSLLPVLQFVHEHQVIHRDIKPENIIRRREDGQLVLVDFGAANFVTRTALRQNGTVIGTLGYAAPEQGIGKANFASDLYSLGVTCLHLLTQIDPFDLFDNSENNWAWRHYLTTPVSEAFGQILDKMVQQATKQRYRSAVEVLQDLNQVEAPSPTQLLSSSVAPPEAIEIGNKWGYKDQTGQVITRILFDGADQFSEGLARVKVGSKYGYIDQTGQLVIQPEFDEVDRFSEGLAKVRIDYKYGYIDKTKQVVIEPQFDRARDFYEGLAAIQLNGKWGYIDQTGEVVIPLEFDEIERFYEGLAAIQLDGKWGYIDRTGEVVIPLQFDDAMDFSEGLAAVKIGDLWGYIDKTGRVVILPQFDQPWDFSKGLAPVKIGNEFDYMYQTGKLVSQMFDYVGNFSEEPEGLAMVKISHKYGYIDRTGKLVIQPQFDYAGDFFRGRAYVSIGQQKRYIDKTGKFID
ncbi:MAG: WG repeat-containing protein [Xenococcaceae cyanobacterium]